MQIRNFAVTILAGILAAAGLALREPKNIKFFNFAISSASALLLAGTIVIISFYFMDRWWYHCLLQGAVKSGEELENELKRTLPNITMSQKIREESYIKVLGYELRSNRKITIFYGIIIAFMIIAAIGVNYSLENNSNSPDYVAYAGNFDISFSGDRANFAIGDNIHGHGILGIRSNKNESDAKSMLKTL